MDLDLEPIRRTRAKTPCFRIGQLEEKLALARNSCTDASRLLADEYQAELLPRVRSPYNPASPKTLPRIVRKVKGHHSLRESLKDDKNDRPYSSDSETTLVGIETPKSQASETSPYFSSKFSPRKQAIEVEEINQKSEEHNDIGLRICLDMLTDELATALFKQKSVEDLDRATGLQIMLMIEAYESVQQRIRQQVHSMDHGSDHVILAEKMLNHWIDMLYALHDQAEEKQFGKSEEPMSATHRPLPSKQPSVLESPDMFFDCEELGSNLPSYSEVH